MNNTGIKYRKVAKVLVENGWHEVRQNGSHVIWGKNGIRISIANRPDGVNRMIVRRLFRENNIPLDGIHC